MDTKDVIYQQLIEEQRLLLKEMRKEMYSVEQQLKSYDEVILKKQRLDTEYSLMEHKLQRLQAEKYYNDRGEEL